MSRGVYDHAAPDDHGMGAYEGGGGDGGGGDCGGDGGE